MQYFVKETLLLFVLLNLVAGQSYNSLWPIPQEYAVQPTGDAVKLSSGFAIVANQPSQILNRAIQRYTSIIMQRDFKREYFQACSNSTMSISKLNVNVASRDETLDIDTSYEYTVTVEDGEASITAPTIYGAMYGMETFSQYSDNGCFNYTKITIHDYPQYKHRGLMIDTGRRFFPVQLVENLVDAMSYLKMNVLHLHFSDFCQFSVQSIQFPALTSSLEQYYTQQDVKGLIQYAKDRGIRIMPEIDIPGHSRGFRPLANLSLVHFCTTNQRELYNDLNGTTQETLYKLLGEMMDLFPDQYFHLGCDETTIVGSCTQEGITSLEGAMLNFTSRQKKTPVGWEEVLFTSKAASSQTVVEAWSRHTASQIIAANHYAIEAAGHHFYLNNKPDFDLCWYDIGPNFDKEQLEMLLGGEMSMWTDNYCRSHECLDDGKTPPVASWMYDKKYNDVFMQSVGGMIWPRGIAAAGSFWHYSEDVDSKSPGFLLTMFSQNSRMAKRGVLVCPSGCACDEVHRCGVPYPHN
ncbi:beta-hexosaminidase subunit beta-like [Dysidea avara]|uniref:beta-hexosaminidase subunit beta-like n=1 Tax=Dysidea avara TaxID=196820 RepID=UPI003332876D